MKKSIHWRRTVEVCVALSMLILLNLRGSRTNASPTPIEHIIVITQQNHSFDNYFGTYPGANGIPRDASIPENPFDLGSNLIKPFPLDSEPKMEFHNGWQYAHAAYNDGQMNGFVNAQNEDENSKLCMGFYSEKNIPMYWKLAREFVLFDNYFSSAMADSFPNMLYLIAGQNGGIRWGSPSTLEVLASIQLTTVFDMLEEKDVSWKYYIGRYEKVLNSTSDKTPSAAYWAPIVSIPRFQSDPQLSSKIVDQEQFYEDAFTGSLPQVCFVLPSPVDHPGSTTLLRAQSKTMSFVDSVMNSKYWQSSVIFILWDDYGGWYDHVPPRQVDRYGYGFRVPMILISSYAKEGYVSHVEHDHTSILKFILDTYELPSLSERVKIANSMADAFDFTKARQPSSVFLQPSTLQPTNPDVVNRVWTLYALLPSFAIGLAIVMLYKKRERRHSLSQRLSESA